MVGRNAKIEGGSGGVVDDGGPVLLGQGEDVEDAANAAGALMLLNVIADGANRGAGVVRRAQDGQRFSRCGEGRSASSMRCQPRGARTCPARCLIAAA